MSGGGGDDQLSVAFDPAEAAAAGARKAATLDLALLATKPAALHDTIGWIDFGAGGSSYYYSRTSMTAAGQRDGRRGDARTSSGTAWFDHQWGDFIAVGGGGWDWFAVNLDDGTDLTLSLVRDADGSYPLVYGTLVDAEGPAAHLPRDAFTVTVTDHWTSPTSGRQLPGRLDDRDSRRATWRSSSTPTVADQELDTRPTTGVVYWEGSQRVRPGAAASVGWQGLRGADRLRAGG